MRHYTLANWIAVALCVGLAALFPAPAPADEGAKQPEGLGRTFEKLRQGKPVTIVYFGGSITWGTGASNPESTSYRALTTQWFQSQFPQAKVTGINAAVGGTGSDYGVFRFGKDVLPHKPDLVFVEFAVNDAFTPKDVIEGSMEGIVRKIRLANPETDIVFVYTTSKALAGMSYDKGTILPSIQDHQAVAAYYGIPEINVGQVLWKAVQDGKGTWETYLQDGVHPRDTGYQVYADAIGTFLKSHLADLAEPPAPLPAPMTRNVFENTQWVDATQAKGTGWVQKDPTLLRMGFPDGEASNQPDSTLTLPFHGTMVGLAWVKAPDSGDVEWTVDGSAPQRESSWDKFCDGGARPSFVILTDKLSPTDHVFTLRVLKDKQVASKGTEIRVAAILVN